MYRLRSYVVLKRFIADESGTTAIEYGLICGMIAVVVLGIAATGGALGAIYDKLAAITVALLGGGGGGGG